MIRSRLAILTLVAVASLTSPVRGHWFADMWCKGKDTYHRNQAWPEPFVYADRASVYAPLNAMVANGWQQYNLMGDPHFDDDTKALTPLGHAKLQRIMSEVVPEHRVIFVQRGPTLEITQGRVVAMHEAAAQIAGAGEAPPILVSTMDIQGWQADKVADIFTKVKTTQPNPTLPAAANDGSGSGSSSGSSGH